MNKVFKKSMKLEKIDSFKEFTKWKKKYPVSIISKQSFKYYGYMDFTDQVQYVTFLEGDLAKKININSLDKVGLRDIENEPHKKQISQTIMKKSFKYLKKSAKRKKSLAYIRYIFTADDIWDREVKITKSLVGMSKDVKEELKGVVYNLPEALKTAHAAIGGKSYSPKLYHPVHDDFDGLIIEFPKVPDFKKRKDINVCGY